MFEVYGKGPCGKSPCLAQLPSTDTLQCDKKGRGGPEDPCSECRHFNGPYGRCVLEEKSFNDVLWADMINRRPTYDLAAEMPRDCQRTPSSAVPQPIVSENIKPDWHGESREALMQKPPFLPQEVRDRPRAYLVPPRVTKAQAKAKLKGQAFLANEQRKRDRANAVPALPVPRMLSEWSQPPLTPAHYGGVARIEVHYHYTQAQGGAATASNLSPNYNAPVATQPVCTLSLYRLVGYVHH